jgi:hypothetical protein
MFITVVLTLSPAVHASVHYGKLLFSQTCWCGAATALQGFTFEDPGGWCTTAFFDVTALASNPNLRQLRLQLVTWECEHCESFELLSLQKLTQLQTLDVCVAASACSIGSSGGGSSSSSSDSSNMGPELLLMLPLLRPAQAVTICSSMHVVLRNSKVLARAGTPGVLAPGIMLEEPLPQRNAAGSSGGKQQKQTSGGSTDTAPIAADHDQQHGSRSSDAAAAALANGPTCGRQQQQQYVRAPAHVVIGALKDLWPNMEVWQYSLRLPAAGEPRAVDAELCCHGTARHSMQQQLTQALVAAMASMVDESGVLRASPRAVAML